VGLCWQAVPPLPSNLLAPPLPAALSPNTTCVRHILRPHSRHLLHAFPTRDGGTHVLLCVRAAGTAKALSDAGVPCEVVYKIHEGRPNPTDLMRNGDIKMIFMTNSNDELDRTDGALCAFYVYACTCVDLCARVCAHVHSCQPSTRTWPGWPAGAANCVRCARRICWRLGMAQRTVVKSASVAGVSLLASTGNRGLRDVCLAGACTHMCMQNCVVCALAQNFILHPSPAVHAPLHLRVQACSYICPPACACRQGAAPPGADAGHPHRHHHQRRVVQQGGAAPHAHRQAGHGGHSRLLP